MDKSIIIQNFERWLSLENINLGSISVGDIPEIINNITKIVKDLLAEINNADDLKAKILELVLDICEKHNIIENIAKKVVEYDIPGAPDMIIDRIINEKVVIDFIKGNMKKLVDNLVDYVLKNENK